VSAYKLCVQGEFVEKIGEYARLADAVTVLRELEVDYGWRGLSIVREKEEVFRGKSILLQPTQGFVQWLGDVRIADVEAPDGYPPEGVTFEPAGENYTADGWAVVRLLRAKQFGELDWVCRRVEVTRGGDVPSWVAYAACTKHLRQRGG